MRKLIVIIVLFFFASPAYAATYYISKNGGGTGAACDNAQTLAWANTNASAGNTYVLCADDVRIGGPTNQWGDGVNDTLVQFDDVEIYVGVDAR